MLLFSSALHLHSTPCVILVVPAGSHAISTVMLQVSEHGSVNPVNSELTFDLGTQSAYQMQSVHGRVAGVYSNAYAAPGCSEIDQTAHAMMAGDCSDASVAFDHSRGCVSWPHHRSQVAA